MTSILFLRITQSLKRNLSYKNVYHNHHNYNHSHKRNLSTNNNNSSKNNNIKFERDGEICIIIINRPQNRNAIDFDTAHQLADAIRTFERDSSIKVGVLYGEGGNFCSGADLKAIEAGNSNRLEDEGDGPLGPSRFELSKPLIAAVSGYAVAGGMELALLCDLRVVEESAIFGVFCRRFGVPLIDGGTVRLPRLIGLSRAMDLILTGRPVDSKEAYAIGLANRIVQDGSAKEAAMELARSLTKFPQECMLADRKSAYQQHNYSISEALRREFTGSKDIAKEKIIDGARRFKNKDYLK